MRSRDGEGPTDQSAKAKTEMRCKWHLQREQGKDSVRTQRVSVTSQAANQTPEHLTSPFWHMKQELELRGLGVKFERKMRGCT